MWYLNSTKIVVTDFNETNAQIIARLQPLASGTVHHIFGYEDPTLKIGVVVVGETDRSSIQNYSKTATAYSLYYDLGGANEVDYGSYLVKSVNLKREPVIRQSIRTDLDCTSSVYTGEIELLREI